MGRMGLRVMRTLGYVVYRCFRQKLKCGSSSCALSHRLCQVLRRLGNILPVFRRMRNWWCIALIRLVLLIRL